MKKLFAVFAFAFVLSLGVGGPLCPAEAVKVKVEVDVDEKGPSKKNPAPETFPVTLRNKLQDKVFVALLYYDGNAKSWRCRGWWGVDGGKERSFKLSHVQGKPIYYYVERGGRAFTRSGTEGGVNRTVAKQAFSYIQDKVPKLDKPYKAHFVKGGATGDGWWRLTVNP